MLKNGWLSMKFNKGDMVMLNPEYDEDMFAHGLAGVGYDEIGTVIEQRDEKYVVVKWLSYGGGWGGRPCELVPLSAENE